MLRRVGRGVWGGSIGLSELGRDLSAAELKCAQESRVVDIDFCAQSCAGVG